MKIVTFSDTHGQHASVRLTKFLFDNAGDLLLFAGDLQANHFDDGKSFVKWLASLPYKHKICVFGNHDGNYEYTLEEANKYDNIKFLMNESINIDGINIFGSPNSVLFMDWYFMYPDNELKDIYEKIPNNTNILLTHTPPFQILDETFDKYNAGSKSLLDRISELNELKYNIFGHIHECYGDSRYGKPRYINSSVLDYKYRMVNEPIVFNY